MPTASEPLNPEILELAKKLHGKFGTARTLAGTEISQTELNARMIQEFCAERIGNLNAHIEALHQQAERERALAAMMNKLAVDIRDQNWGNKP